MLPSLDHLRVFETAARHMSFKLAAAEMNVTPAAVSQRIRTLENQLQTKLFHRQVRQIELTREGRLLAADLSTAFSRVNDAISRLNVSRGKAVLRVSSTHSIAELLLLPALAEFRRIKPECAVRIVSTDERLDPSRHETDVCIRFGRGSYPNSSVIQLGEHSYTPVCSPSFAAKIGPIGKPQDLLGLPLIEERWPVEHKAAPSWKSWLLSKDVELDERAEHLSVSLAAHAIKLAEQGQGVALVNTVYLSALAGQPTLIELFDQDSREVSQFQHFLLFRKNDKSPELSAFIEWIQSIF